MNSNNSNLKYCREQSAISLLAITIILIVMALFVYWLFGKVATSDEIHSKREWSVLQNVEEHMRKDPRDILILIEKRDIYFCAGILSRSKKDRVWILLNPEFAPFIKVLGDREDFTLRNTDLNSISKAYPVHNEVLNFLQNKVEK